uniref:clp protease proteolytic subunit n=1 Tax=Acacia crassicarpa TaxID=499986 RepID=UPI001BF02383|nr:clp protease proteolytic subunit [Acacia crassicarpa]QUG09657.1 ATP-dependent Clp protease proteolytic subunit [Acacia crassicarpa]UXF57740.1 clp protease proteolytic subunit [Acacia crassicarpa]
MPIGVPRVPYKPFLDRESYWVDIYNRLYRQRILFIGQMIESTTANQVTGLLIHLNIEDSKKDIEFFINCPGGSVIAGLAIYDMMQIVESEIQTVCVGLAASMGSLILLGGETTKRIAFPHARVMMHQPMADLGTKTKAGDSVLEMNEIISMYHSIVTTYVRRTGKPSWVVHKDISRDIFMSAEEAQAHGIVDHVGIQKESK